MERTLTLKEAAVATGLTAKALQRRIDRGSVRSLLVGGMRRVPVAELVRLGLLDPDNPSAGEVRVGSGQEGERVTRPVLDVAELLDRLERQAVEIGELRALTREAESLRLVADQEREQARRLEEELHQLRARVLEFEARPRRRRWMSTRRAA